MVTQESIVDRIERLIAEEHELREQQGLASNDRSRVEQIDVELDQCWDLLRQRRARLAASADPADATVRDADTVEGYEQ